MPNKLAKCVMDLKSRLETVMSAMNWRQSDLARVTQQSSSVVSQWLGHGTKEIKTIGKLEAALFIERQSGYSALWVAKGIGPKLVRDLKAAELSAREPNAAYAPTSVGSTLRALASHLAAVPPPLRGAIGDLLRGWALDGGDNSRLPILESLLEGADKTTGGSLSVRHLLRMRAEGHARNCQALQGSPDSVIALDRSWGLFRHAQRMPLR